MSQRDGEIIATAHGSDLAAVDTPYLKPVYFTLLIPRWSPGTWGSRFRDGVAMLLKIMRVESHLRVLEIILVSANFLFTMAISGI